MMERLFQPGLLAQDDASEWMNILFIVVVAVFWAIGGLVKAAGNKNRQQGARKDSQPASGRQKRETWLQQLAKKAEEIQRAMEMEGAKEQPKPRPRPPQPPQKHPAQPGRPPEGHVTVRTGRDGRSVLVYERPQSQRPAPAPPKPAATQPRPQPARSARRRVPSTSPQAPAVPEQPVKKRVPAAKTITPAKRVSSPLIDYADPDALKRAILQYEILGRPMALRDPFERASGS